MSATLTVRDETSAGQTTGELVLEFLTERITVRELIRSRVYQEVQDHNLDLNCGRGDFRGLVQPSPPAGAPGGGHADREIDWRRQVEVALEAFERNRFLLLVNDRQAESLDDPIEIRPETQVTFLKLVPLVGG